MARIAGEFVRIGLNSVRICTIVRNIGKNLEKSIRFDRIWNKCQFTQPYWQRGAVYSGLCLHSVVAPT